MINKELVELLIEKGLTIGFIESFTGGKASSLISEIPGCSKTFLGSIVSYNVKVKENVVGVDPNIINKYSVVSKEVAEEMAIKGSKVLNSDVTVSFTGNAGPSSDIGDKEVGLCYITIKIFQEIETFELNIKKPRNELIIDAISFAFEKLFKKIQIYRVK